LRNNPRITPNPKTFNRRKSLFCRKVVFRSFPTRNEGFFANPK
jgi:hypothetical protein